MFNLKKILPVIIFTIYIFLYHSYVLGFLFVHPAIALWEFIIGLIFFHIFFSLMVWSTLATIFQPLPIVPEKYRLTAVEIKLYNHCSFEQKQYILNYFYEKKELNLRTRTPNLNLRYCVYEYQFKPDRAHHCSQCGMCVLKMDHHCQWLNTCICFTNQKGFILILFYTFWVCLVYVCSGFHMFVSFWTINQKQRVQEYPAVIGFILAALLGTISAIFFMFHFGLIAQNKTLIEDMMPAKFASEKETYNLGVLPNIAQVFGYNIALWFFPVFSQEGDGVFFPTRRIRKAHSEEEEARHKLERDFSDFVR
ncbi:palmitoyltransferase ZDHHC15B-like [Diabrotica undecimpunctata]|uniref:palmitoyltransferase ZDHHC15B-like n=1 Tax=Diabrotica undecimpunctata TaxID=50387 RepID=UPI003B63A107